MKVYVLLNNSPKGECDAGHTLFETTVEAVFKTEKEALKYIETHTVDMAEVVEKEIKE